VIYHLALAADWARAVAAGEYRVSTIGVSLDTEGFIHASRAHQVAGVARRYYAAVSEPLVLLAIDEDRLDSPVRVDAAPGVPEGFPHVYGPIGVGAVVRVDPLARDDDGVLELPALDGS